MQFDYSKLKGKIAEVYGTQYAFAKEFGVSKNSFSRKLHNKIRFSVDDIIKIVGLLSIRTDEIGAYFFTIKV